VKTEKPRRQAGPVVRRILVLLACASLATQFAALAQTTGTIEGTVTDPDGAPLPGVSVELASPSLQGTRTATTSGNGRYRFPSLPPGSYRVTASLPGFGRVQKMTMLSLDATATVHLRLALTATAEVTVSGEAPIVDSTSTTAGTAYDAGIIGRLPVGRNYADIVFAQPGVQADFGEGPPRALAISIYGSTSAENVYLIDGVDTTDVVKGIQGKDINYEFVQEVEVKASGYPAEYGHSTGGVINVITKSGGNDFHGGVFGYYNDTGMRADPRNGEPANYATPDYSERGDAQAYNYILSKDVRQEWGVDLGGYAWKDRVWFFAAYDRVQINQNLQMLDVTNPETFDREFPTSYVQNKYSGKITLNLTPATSLVGSVFSDAQTQNGAIAVPTSLDSLSYSGRVDTGGPDYGARLSRLFGSSGMLDLQYARHSDRFETTPVDPTLPQVQDYTYSDPFSAIASGGYGSVFGPTKNNHSTRQSFGASFTAYAGNMELKIGGAYREDTTSGSTYYTGGERLRIRPCQNSYQNPGGTSYCDLTLAPFHTNSLGETTQVFYEHNRFATGTFDDYVPVAASAFTTPTKRWSGYLQDQWRIAPNLTIDLGIRYDSESFYGLDPQTGPFQAFALTNQWAPRLGFAWDFAGDGSSRLFGSAGRFYYALPTDLNIHIFTASSQLSTFNYSPTDATQNPSAPRNTLFQGGNATGEPVDPGTREAYLDEATLGVEKAFGPALSVSLTGIYRSLGQAIEDRCDLDPQDPASRGSMCALFNPGGTGPAGSGQISTCDGSGNPTDPNAGQCGFPGVAVSARRFFRGIALAAREQFSDALWAQASFLYSSLEGNYSGAVMETTGQTDPGINADYDYYQFSENAFGRMELDRPVQARLDAVYYAPFGLSAGLSFYVRSGRPTSRIGWFNTFYPTNLFVVTRGSSGRLPTDYDMSLSLAYDLSVGPVTITPMLYGFNLLNRQTPNDVSQEFNPAGSFVTNPASPFYGQAGVEPGTERPDGTICESPVPCSDSPDYRKVTQRLSPRLLRVALKVTF
jgi:hypothetical protein